MPVIRRRIRSSSVSSIAARRDVVRRTAYLLCGDWHWADDLTQVAFMRLAVSWRRVRDRGAWTRSSGPA